MKLREFNDKGVEAFRTALTAMRTDPTAAVPFSLLEDATLTVDVGVDIELDRPGFATKREAATYLHAKLRPLMAMEQIFDRVGLWSWLSLHYFDDVCPPVKHGRNVRVDSSYVFHPSDRRYDTRHLLMTPVLIYTAAPVHNKLFLDTPLSMLGKAVEETIKKLFVTRFAGVFEAIELLYWDPTAGRPKKNLTPIPPRAGDLKSRFPARLRQLQRTYDVAVMSGTQIVTLLGREFEGWWKTTANDRR